MLRKTLYSLGILMLMGTVLTPRVDASLVLRLTDTVTNFSVTVFDTDFDGFVSFSGAVGSSAATATWFVNVSTGISKPILGPTTMDLNSVNVSRRAGTLKIELSDTDFPISTLGGNLIGGIGGTTDGTINVFGYKSLTNEEFSTDDLLASVHMGPFGSNSKGFAFSGSDSDAHGPIVNPYSMTLVATIVHGNPIPGSQGSATSFDYHLQNTVVPVPAGVVIFAIGGALMGVGEWLRRRRRVVVA